MDVRLSPEQLALRDSVRMVLGDLAPRTVAELDDPARSAKLAAAVSAAGWYDLRTGDARTERPGAPLASGVEVCIVAEELGRGLADVAFLGPTLAAELRRLSGTPTTDAPETVLLSAELASFAAGAEEATAVDAAGATRALAPERRSVLRTSRSARSGDHGTLVEVALGPSAVTVDLTRPVAYPASEAHVVPGAGSFDGAALDGAALDRVTALGLAVACADLVGTMAGAVALATSYATERHQYGRPVGSFQAVQHMLADAHVVTEGSRSLARHAAWAVDALEPREALVAAATAKAYAARAARTVCETAIQVHGGIGNTWECLAHVQLRRALLSADLFGGVDACLERVLEDRLGNLADERVPDARPGSNPVAREVAVDFGDSPEEAAFRTRLRRWLVDNTPDLPASSTSDDYWAGQAEWHRSLYDAGFFGLSFPGAVGGHGLPSVYEVIVDEELSAAGAPPRPSLGYLVWGILEHGSDDVRARFLPGIVSGRDRWCQGFSEPDAGSDLAALRTRAVLDGDEWVITGHKVWTSYSDAAEWCLVLARTDTEAPPHKGISAFAVPMDQPGVQQRPLRMINGITREFGEVTFDGARTADGNMIGAPGEGWRLAMTVVSHEREPGELGYVARYRSTVHGLLDRVRRDPDGLSSQQRQELAWAIVETEMLRRHVSRRLSERLDGITHGPEGSVDKLLMTWTEQTVGHAALDIGGAGHTRSPEDDAWLETYLYSRAQSVMGGTSQIQRNLVATRILGLPAS